MKLSSFFEIQPTLGTPIKACFDSPAGCGKSYGAHYMVDCINQHFKPGTAVAIHGEHFWSKGFEDYNAMERIYKVNPAEFANLEEFLRKVQLPQVVVATNSVKQLMDHLRETTVPEFKRYFKQLAVNDTTEIDIDQALYGYEPDVQPLAYVAEAFASSQYWRDLGINLPIEFFCPLDKLIERTQARKGYFDLTGERGSEVVRAKLSAHLMELSTPQLNPIIIPNNFDFAYLHQKLEEPIDIMIEWINHEKKYREKD